MSKIFDKLKDIYKIYGYFYFRIWSLHLLVIISLIFLDVKYFVYAVGVFVVYMPLVQLITHEYISHEYIKPRNQIIDLIVLLIFYTLGQSIRGKRDYHINHHRYWQDLEKDPTQQKMNQTTMFRYIFAFQRPISQHLEPIRNSLLNNRWVKVFDKHSLTIHWIYTLTLIVILPWPWIIVMCGYFPWLSITVFAFHDQLFHGKIKSRDHSWYLPIFGSQAWHIKHHEEYRVWYHGPGIWKWLNLAWYYQLLFFKDTKQNLE